VKDEVGALTCEDGQKRRRPEARRGKRRTATPTTTPLDAEREKLARLELLLLERPGLQPDDG
jgi:hypothetical protein